MDLDSSSARLRFPSLVHTAPQRLPAAARLPSPAISLTPLPQPLCEFMAVSQTSMHFCVILLGSSCIFGWAWFHAWSQTPWAPHGVCQCWREWSNVIARFHSMGWMMHGARTCGVNLDRRVQDKAMIFVTRTQSEYLTARVLDKWDFFSDPKCATAQFVKIFTLRHGHSTVSWW